MPGGPLRDLLRFERRALDDAGERTGDWEPFVTTAAQVRPIQGREEVLAQRLQGIQPFAITLRASPQSLQVDNTFRAIDARAPATQYEIKSAYTTEDRAWRELLAVKKVGQTVG